MGRQAPARAAGARALPAHGLEPAGTDNLADTRRWRSRSRCRAPTRSVQFKGRVLDDSGVLRRGDALHRALVGSVAARAELSERAGVKRVTVHDAAGAHDITDYAARLRFLFLLAKVPVRCTG